MERAASTRPHPTDPNDVEALGEQIAELAAKVKTFRAHLRQEETLSKALGLH